MGSRGGGCPAGRARHAFARVCRLGRRAGGLAVERRDSRDRHGRPDGEPGTRTRMRNRLRIPGYRPVLGVRLAHSVIVVAATLVHSVIPARFGWVCPACRRLDGRRGPASAYVRPVSRGYRVRRLPNGRTAAGVAGSGRVPARVPPRPRSSARRAGLHHTGTRSGYPRRGGPPHPRGPRSPRPRRRP